MECPCGSGKSYSECCEPLHAGKAAETAEALMRSRYCAYALGLADYLYETHHPDKRPKSVDGIREWAERAKFERLEVLNTAQGGPSDKIGKVEFRAHYREDGKKHQLQEVSRFRRFQGRWVYYDGSFKG